jgi:DNA polymerase
VLSLGFGGAVGAFQAMAKNYGLTLADNVVKNIVQAWRRANPWAQVFWKELEVAALRAVRQPQTLHSAGRVRYIFVPKILGGTLMCILPNDTVIQYPYAKIENGGVTAMKASVQPKSDSQDEWPRMSLYGGFLCENVCQATAACLLREALAELDVADMPVVGHCHDEIIMEMFDDEVEEDKNYLQKVMELAPDWADGLPLKAVPVVMERYGK